MKHSNTIIIIVLILILSLSTSIAYSQTGEARLIVTDSESDDTPKVQDVDYPSLGLEVTPINESGVPIAGLSNNDFNLREGGIPVDDFIVNQFTDSDQGISIMLVLDLSGSMRDDLEELRSAALALYDYLEQTDQSGIIGFSELADGTGVDLSDPFPQIDPNKEMIFTNDEGALINLINALEIEEFAGTPLYDAAFKGVRMAGETGFGRRAVILMTDGVDQDRNANQPGSKIADAETVVEEARRSHVPIFTIGLGDDIDSVFLQRAATLTGGTYQSTPDAAQLGELFTDIASRLKQKYQLSYESQTESDDALHDLNVRVQTPIGAAEETVSFRARYPVVPWIRLVEAELPRQEAARELSTYQEIKGRVNIVPDIVARGALAEVNFYVDDVLAFTATETPWEFEWQTSELVTSDEPETFILRIEASDDEEPANTGTVSESVQIVKCSRICQFEIDYGFNPYYLFGLLLLLLVAFVAFLVLRRRREELEPVPVTTFEGTPATPETLPFDVATTEEPISSTPVGPTQHMEGSDPYPLSQPPLKTEVLRKELEHIAFLIDKVSARQFPLSEETTIGREAGNDITLDDSAIGRRHAKIRFEEGEFVFYDLAATNKTIINGEEITRHQLKENDEIEMGRQRLIFKRLT